MTDNDKRQIASSSDVNNNEIINSSKKKCSDNSLYASGQIKELHLLNFMCYQNFSMQFYSTHMQIVMGANGSGKSSIANAICLCLGAQARTTGRTSNAQSFIRKDETSAEITIVLANEGPEAFKPEVYGKEIRIIRKIGSRQSGYKILDAHRKVISTHKETIGEITQALSISPENPLCVLHQDIAKTFLISNDPSKKYQFYMKVSQLDQIKQAYEQGVYTVQLLTQRVNAMKEKHIEMLRELEPLEQEIRKIEIRRNYEERKHELDAELSAARADKARQELLEIQYELDELQRTKHDINTKTTQENDRIVSIDRRLEYSFIEKNDLEKDNNGLRQLRAHFAKQKHNLQLRISSLKRECEDYRTALTEVELKQIYLQKQVDKHDRLHRECANTDEQRLQIDHELLSRQEKQIEWDRIRLALSNDLCVNEKTMSGKQTSIDILEHELQQKQQDLDQLIQINQNRTNVYGLWMMGCLKTIQNDPRFHNKPIGPIGLHIHCTNSHWSYAIEKHLAPIMSSFICTDDEDEKILLEILASYSADHRPPVYVRSYSNKAHDISGTLKYTKQRNLLTIYDVLKIDNITVECVLIDVKQIEATVLLESLEQAKQLQQSGVLSWKKIDRKVKQVTEVWTYDGSNVKLDKIFRIYTNEKQTIKYFPSDSFQSLSIEELETDIRHSSEQLQQMRESMENVRTIHQTIVDQVSETDKENDSNKKKLTKLMKELDHLNSIEPVPLDYPLDQLQEEAREYLLIYDDIIRKYDEVKEKIDAHLQHLSEITENYENINKKLDSKIYQYDLLVEEIRNEQTQRYEVTQKIKQLSKRSSQFNEEIHKYQTKLNQLKEKQLKKSKRTTKLARSVRSIEQELYAINNYLKANEDTNEIRREIIHQYRSKRGTAKEYKQTYERCYRQIENLNRFIQRRQEGFLTIADQHQYCLRIHFENLMKKYHFHESTIHIDHKKEELDIIVKKQQTNLASLSSGERSIATFCFLLALWESIYQPFRLLDEIDIYMDHEKRHSSLDILYQNTLLHSSSQHIIFTPQTIDVQLWNEFDVPVFSMPTPKRSI